MSDHERWRRHAPDHHEGLDELWPARPRVSPGKKTLTMRLPPVQRDASEGGALAEGAAGAVARAAGGAGQPLPLALGERLAGSLGADMGGVRVHTDEAAAGAARALRARAYTTGQDIFFASGKYDPGSAAGQRLIAHEVAHTVQQAGGQAGPPQARLEVSAPGDALESEAEAFAISFVTGARAPAVSRGALGGGVLARDAEPAQTPAADPAACPAPYVPRAVPPVVDVGAIDDPVARNQAINQSYHAFDGAMTHYLGDPLVSNWCTYGQHASREAGAQIANLEAGIETMRDALEILTSTIIQTRNPVVIVRNARRAYAAIQRVVALLQEPGMVRQGIQLAMTKAGITPADLQGVVDAATDLTTFQPSDLLPGATLYELVTLGGRVLYIAGRLVAATPAIIATLFRIRDNLVLGNRGIYENIAPAYASFLAAAAATTDGVLNSTRAFQGDASGFLSAAFTEYSEVRRLQNEISCLPAGDPQRAALVTQRTGKAHRANLLIGFQEQLIILQPIFDTMQEELEAMGGTMVLRDPNGTHDLAPNWGDFYTRMGIDPDRAPADPRTITPDNLPAMLDRSDPRYRGTIGEYFEDGLTNRRIHDAPPNIERH